MLLRFAVILLYVRKDTPPQKKERNISGENVTFQIYSVVMVLVRRRNWQLSLIIDLLQATCSALYG